MRNRIDGYGIGDSMTVAGRNTTHHGRHLEDMAMAKSSCRGYQILSVNIPEFRFTTGKSTIGRRETFKNALRYKSSLSIVESCQ